jgi:hypothetical protein
MAKNELEGFMQEDESSSQEHLGETYAAYNAFFDMVRAIGERDIEEGRKAMELIEAKRAIEEQIAEGTNRSLAKAEILMQGVADKFR